MQKELQLVLGEMAKVISGKDAVTQKILMAILADGHILLDDVPGVGKTTLAVALGRITGLAARRIQLTPDVLPSDVVGYSVYHKESGQMEYRPGIVLSTNLLLADEINRTSSKTQSAFLEAMEERQVTVDGNTYPLQTPFIVIATQNHVGAAGTQRLPYAQLDRFMVSLTMGYPDREAQLDLLKRRQNVNPMDTLLQALSLERVREMQREVQAVLAKDSILGYIADLAIASRESDMIQIGLSPRAAIHLDRLSKARAYMMERDYVIPEDVQAVLPDAAAHRIILTPQAGMNGVTARQALQTLIDTVPAPDWK